MNHLVLYCRPGFEPDLAAEISDLAQQCGFYGYVKTEAQSGYVVYVLGEHESAWKLMKLLDFRKVTFARQWFAALPLLTDLDGQDRITPILAAAKALPQCGELVIETADTNEAKELANFCRKFTSPSAAALRKAGVLSAKRNNKLPRLHLFFLNGQTLYLGISNPSNASTEPMGILRLKFPAKAPSRSTLKLEEAWHCFLSKKERERLLAPAMTAVDLGAAPGGWTWQLVKQHIRVIAVDNGPMHQDLMDSGIVTHAQEDGFRYQPPKPVHWMVCDIVDKPSRVAELAARWLAEGWCERAIFNLKLPMKKRYAAVQEAAEIIEQALEGRAYLLDIKHLYHDREEVTCYLRWSK